MTQGHDTGEGFGDAVKRLREEMGFPMSKFAEVCGISRTTVRRLENGEPAANKTLRALKANFGAELEAAGIELPTPPRDDRVYWTRVMRVDRCQRCGGAITWFKLMQTKNERYQYRPGEDPEDNAPARFKRCAECTAELFRQQTAARRH